MSLLQDDGEDSDPDSAPTKEAEAEAEPPSCLYEEVANESAHHQTAIFVILRSGGSVVREITHVAAQSMHEYIRCVKWDWEDRTHILPIMNCF